MNESLKKIVAILEEGKPELKIAAAQILGELGPKEPAITGALADRLTHEETFLTPFILEALAQIGTADAVAALVEKLNLGGAMADRVARLLGQMGGNATKPLAKVFEGGDTETRARVIGILGRHEDRDALKVLLQAALQPDPMIADKAGEALAERLPNLDDAEREVLKKSLQKSLSGQNQKTPDLETGALAHAVRLLGRIDAAGNRATLLRFTGGKQEPVVRQAALTALQGVELTDAQVKTLLPYLAEQDMTHVARPAMAALEGIDKWPAGCAPKLKELLSARREERVLFALRALRKLATPEMAKVCTKHLLHGSPEFQDAAAEALGNNAKAVPTLLKSFQNEKNLDRARLYARPLVSLGKHIKPEQIKGLADRAGKLISAGEPVGEVILRAVVEIDPAVGGSEVVDKALRMRRAKKFHEAAAILMRLAQTESMPAEGQYQLAVTRLILDNLEGRSGEVPANGDATMGYIAGLVRQGFPLHSRLCKEGQLAPEDLLRVGRHFAEGVATERRFGAELLQHVAAKHAQKRAGEEAKLIMRSEGL